MITVTLKPIREVWTQLRSGGSETERVVDRANEKMQMFARYFLNYIQTQVLELSGLKITLTVAVIYTRALTAAHGCTAV